MKTIRAIAPAKVNLHLHVGARREDGYHSVETIMHALALHDTLTITHLGAGEARMLFEPCDAAQPLRQFEAQVKAGSGLAVSANTVWREGLEGTPIADEDNLACRAVHALAQHLGRTEDELVRIVIEKHIPAQAGLGGGSADAAAALVGTAALWGIPATHPALEHVARTLGADVPFFLHGGCALMSGLGDTFTHALAPRRDTLVVIKPEGGVNTRACYTAFDEIQMRLATTSTDPQTTETLPVIAPPVEDVQHAEDVQPFNNLERAASSVQPNLADVRAFLASRPEVHDTLLCGSGSATCAFVPNLTSANTLVAAAQARGWWARSTSFSAIRAACLPER